MKKPSHKLPLEPPKGKPKKFLTLSQKPHPDSKKITTSSKRILTRSIITSRISQMKPSKNSTRHPKSNLNSWVVFYSLSETMASRPKKLQPKLWPRWSVFRRLEVTIWLSCLSTIRIRSRFLPWSRALRSRVWTPSSNLPSTRYTDQHYEETR